MPSRLSRQTTVGLAVAAAVLAVAAFVLWRMQNPPPRPLEDLPPAVGGAQKTRPQLAAADDPPISLGKPVKGARGKLLDTYYRGKDREPGRVDYEVVRVVDSQSVELVPVLNEFGPPEGPLHKDKRSRHFVLSGLATGQMRPGQAVPVPYLLECQGELDNLVFLAVVMED